MTTCVTSSRRRSARPSGGNAQPWHFLVVRDARQRARLGELYREAWWAKRRDAGIHGPQDIDPADAVAQSAMRLADEIGQAPLIVLVCATAPGAATAASVIPATQNLLLAARALGVGATITTLHADVDDRVRSCLRSRRLRRCCTACRSATRAVASAPPTAGRSPRSPPKIAGAAARAGSDACAAAALCYRPGMCRSIKRLRTGEVPASDDEIAEAALQFVRKVSGFRKPSPANGAVFDSAVDEVAVATRRLLQSLQIGARARS